MKEGQLNIWLGKTIFWKQLIVWGLGLLWIGSIVTSLVILLQSIEEVGGIEVLIIGLAIAWAGYIINTLHLSLEATKAYHKSGVEVLWQEALLYQRQFWRLFCPTFIVLLVLFVLIVLGLSQMPI